MSKHVHQLGSVVHSVRDDVKNCAAHRLFLWRAVQNVNEAFIEPILTDDLQGNAVEFLGCRLEPANERCH